METVSTRPHVATLREWCRTNKVKMSTGYELSRVDAIPGMYRIGRQIRINMDEFFAQMKQAS